MEERHRKKSKLSQLVIPLVTNITRKLSRKEKDVNNSISEEKDRPDTLALDYPLDFVSQMKEVFREFDKVINSFLSILIFLDQDKSGFICVRELGRLMRALGNNPTHSEVNQLMARADVDHNGRLDIREFIRMMHNYNTETDDPEAAHLQRTGEIMQAFRLSKIVHFLEIIFIYLFFRRAFDRRGDGKIAIEDVKLFLRHFGDFCSEPEIERLIVKFDENKNGFFEKEEFINFLSFIQY